MSLPTIPATGFVSLTRLAEAALQPLPGLLGLRGSITRQRRRPVAEDDDFTVNVFLHKARGGSRLMGIGGPLDWTTGLAIECMARAGAATSPDEAIDPVLQAAHQLLVQDPALQAAQFYLNPEVDLEWDQIEADERVGGVILFYSVRHRTTATFTGE